MSSGDWISKTLRLQEDEARAPFGPEIRPTPLDNQSIQARRAKVEESEPKLLRHYDTALTAFNILYEAAAANSRGARKVLAKVAHDLDARAGKRKERTKHLDGIQIENVNEKTRG